LIIFLVVMNLVGGTPKCITLSFNFSPLGSARERWSAIGTLIRSWYFTLSICWEFFFKQCFGLLKFFRDFFGYFWIHFLHSRIFWRFFHFELTFSLQELFHGNFCWFDLLPSGIFSAIFVFPSSELTIRLENYRRNSFFNSSPPPRIF